MLTKVRRSSFILESGVFIGRGESGVFIGRGESGGRAEAGGDARRRTTGTRLPSALVALLAVAALGLAACGGSPGGAAASDGTLTVYSGRSEELVGPLLAQFTEETGIRLDVRYGDTAELAAQILEEGQATPAEVFFAQDAGALGAVAAGGVAVPLPADVTDLVPSAYVGPERLWVAVTGRARSFIWNPTVMGEQPRPQTVLDLTAPQWAGKVAIAPTNASFQAFVTALRRSVGEAAAEEWLRGLVANEVRTYEKNSQIVEAADRGEIGIGLINHYYVMQVSKGLGRPLRAELGFFAPGDVGSLVNVAGVLQTTTGARDPDALTFIAWLLAPAAQDFFVTQTNEYAVIDGAAQPSGVPPLSTLQGPDVDLADLVDLPGTIDLLGRVGLL